MTSNPKSKDFFLTMVPLETQALPNMFALCFLRTLDVKLLCHDKAPSLSFAMSPKVRCETLLYEGRLKV